MQRSSIILGDHDLKNKHVVIIGVGGTGCTVAQLLARYGISLTLIDRDIVEKHNLERQTLFSKDDIGKAKVFVAKEKLKHFTNVSLYFEDCNEDSINKQISKNTDLIIDCTDNNETRLVINDFCKKNKLPWIYSAAVERKGAFAFMNAMQPDHACFQCFNEEKYGETCNEVGVLNSTVSAIASFVVDNAINYLVFGKFDNDLFHLNLATQTLVRAKLKQNPKCQACKGNYLYLDGKKTKQIIRLCGNERFSLQTKKPIDLNELEKILKKQNMKIKKSEYALKTDDFLIFSHGRIVVTAKTKEEAKKKYDEVLGFL